MTSRLDRIAQQRQEKLARIRARGVDPYPRRYQRTHTAQEAIALLKQREDGLTQAEKVSVAGRITARRPMGKSSFIDIRDGSGKIQLLFQDINRLDEDDLQLFKDLDIGDIIGVEGNLIRTKSGEPTVWVGDFTLLTKSLKPLPEKWHGLHDIDIRHRQRYLDLIANVEVKELFQVRSQVITAVREFLNRRGFLEVETPVLQPSAGGALARPFVTHHHALDQDFYLRIAPELYLKRLIIGGFDKVYELGRIFRNEGISTKHNPEFTMLETYEAYADYNDVMKMVEEMVSGVCQQVLGTEQVEFGDNIINFKPPWQRLSLRQAVTEYSGIDFVKYPNADSLRAKMRDMGLEVDPEKNWGRLVDELLSTFVEGEAREVAKVFAAVAREIDHSGQPLARPACVVAGGETTVTVRGRGLGGRSQELALAVAPLVAGLDNVAIVALGTDGTDGPTDAAGALCTGRTAQRASQQGLSVADYLADNDSYHFFEALGDLLVTGPTNTNVNDLVFIFAF